MKYPHLLAILGLCAGQVAWADLTMRHTLDFKFGSFLPPAAVEAMKVQLADQLPKETIVQIKGRKAYTSMGRMVVVADYANGVITLIDSKERRFAAFPMAAYADKIAAVQKQRAPVLPPEAQEIFDKIQFDVKTSQTGQMATIQGIRAEENVLTISIEIPTPTGTAMQMRMEMHQWTAVADEVDRIPALKELEVYATVPKAGLDLGDLMTKSLSSFPGMADKLRGPMQELVKSAGKAMLRIQTSMYMPAMAQMAGGAADQPFADYTVELAELSSATLPDTRFEVPAGYQSASMDVLMEALFPTPKATMPLGRHPGGQPKAQIPTGEPVLLEPAGPLPPGVNRVGSGVQAPEVLYKTEPSYTEEARAAKIEGSVLLNVVVGADGNVQTVTVQRSLEPGLDQKAMETVRKWKFKPGTKDGQPVSLEARIEVNYRLLK